jgi:predicted nucleic acid-binding protein
VASDRIAYADSSALVKLVLEEPETAALRRHLRNGARVATSEVAIVEVTRAVRIAAPGASALDEARRVLDGAALIGLTRSLLERAADLASAPLRSLDAIHLATALSLEPDELLAYDRRLLEGAARAGLAVVSPGA